MAPESKAAATDSPVAAAPLMVHWDFAHRNTSKQYVNMCNGMFSQPLSM
jgi:hypothetical protein